jgi:hypothetical protein
MRRRRGASTAILAALALACTACGASSAHAGSTTPSRPVTTPPRAVNDTSTTKAVPPTTRVNPTAANQLAQFVLTSALTAAKSIYDKTYDYTAVSPTSLAPFVPNVKFAALNQASDGVVGVLAQDRHDVFFVTRSASGRWYCITENDTDGVSYGGGATFSDVDSNGECQQPQWP